MTLSLRNRLLAVCFSTLVFSGLGMLAVMVVRGDPERAAPVILGIGLSLSLLEEFYIQGRPGRWLRAMHPAISMLIYGLLITVFALTAMATVRTYMGHMMDAPEGRHMHDAGAMPEMRGGGWPGMVVVFPALFAISIVTIMTLRVVGYLGGANLFHLMTGKYYRPVLEHRIYLFLDINGSTAIVEELGPLRTRELIGKFFFDISAPISDNGGEIYRYVGDGVVAVWLWETGTTRNRIIRAIDGIRRAVEKERDHYERKFGQMPRFRIGVHGGEVVTSEEGDTRRAIGFYGDAIHVAARVEQMAKEVDSQCLVSEAVVKALAHPDPRLKPIGNRDIRGIKAPVALYELGREAEPTPS